MTTSRGFAIFKKIELFSVLFLISFVLPSSALAASSKHYFPVAGLIDLRTSFSDGAHSPEDLVTLARLRGFRVLFFNDHHRVRLSYGVPPFRNLLKYSKELPSIMTHGPQAYFKAPLFLYSSIPSSLLSTTGPDHGLAETSQFISTTAKSWPSTSRKQKIMSGFPLWKAACLSGTPAGGFRA